ncbi:MAG: hypothetical protein AMXMBFR64_37980 [Myxococcales bacterium]
MVSSCSTPRGHHEELFTLLANAILRAISAVGRDPAASVESEIEALRAALRPVPSDLEQGDRLSSPAVIAQTRLSLKLARRDAEGLAANGWAVKKTDALEADLAALEAANASYTARFGAHSANGKAVAAAVGSAKKWRVRTLAIGHAALTGEALGALEKATSPTRGRADRLAQQIQALADIVEAHEALFKEEGASDGHLAEGKALAAALAQGTATQASRRRDLPAAHDELDELDGRIFFQLKALHRSGRAHHLTVGDRARANEYNLDLLYNR